MTEISKANETLQSNHIFYDFKYNYKNNKFQCVFESEILNLTSGWHIKKKNAKTQVCKEINKYFSLNFTYSKTKNTPSINKFYEWEKTFNIPEFKIKDKKALNLFKLAFMHKSFFKTLSDKDKQELKNHLGLSNNTNKLDQDCDYERLEILGDSIITFIVVKYLYHNGHSPGKITQLKNEKISGKNLAALCDKHKWSEHLLTHNSNVTQRLKNNLYESSIGALSLIYGMSFCKDFIIKDMF